MSVYMRVVSQNYILVKCSVHDHKKMQLINMNEKNIKGRRVNVSMNKYSVYLSLFGFIICLIYYIL